MVIPLLRADVEEDAPVDLFRKSAPETCGGECKRIFGAVPVGRWPSRMEQPVVQRRPHGLASPDRATYKL